MNDFNREAWGVVLAAEVSQEIREDVAHRKARAQALWDAIENGDFERDPYSRCPTPRSFTAPCGCTARQEWESDGDTQWKEWAWSDSKCKEGL